MRNIDKLIKERDFETPADYYEYILDSIANGQRPQAVQLYQNMRKVNREIFLFSFISELSNQIEIIKLFVEV